MKPGCSRPSEPAGAAAAAPAARSAALGAAPVEPAELLLAAAVAEPERAAAPADAAGLAMCCSSCWVWLPADCMLLRLGTSLGPWPCPWPLCCCCRAEVPCAGLRRYAMLRRLMPVWIITSWRPPLAAPACSCCSSCSPLMWLGTGVCGLTSSRPAVQHTQGLRPGLLRLLLCTSPSEVLRIAAHATSMYASLPASLDM